MTEKSTGYERKSALIFIKIFIDLLCFILFCLVSAFVLLFGKANTGIKLYYAFASVLLWGVILF